MRSRCHPIQHYGVYTEFENKTHSITNECSIQVLSLYDDTSCHHNKTNITIQKIYFSENDTVVAGSSQYGGLLDRCTVSHLAERNTDNNSKSKLQSAEVQGIGIAYLKTINNIKIVNIDTPPGKVAM